MGSEMCIRDRLCAYNDAFVQVHQSFIINMNYLLMVQDNRCIMYPPFNNIGELTVSKKYKKEGSTVISVN